MSFTIYLLDQDAYESASASPFGCGPSQKELLPVLQVSLKVLVEMMRLIAETLHCFLV